jgi:hypothetical protein
MTQKPNTVCDVTKTKNSINTSTRDENPAAMPALTSADVSA